MKGKLQWTNCLLAILVLVFSGITLAGDTNTVAPPNGTLVTVLNPTVVDQLADRVPLAPRLDTLEGKTIYIVDMNYEGLGHTAVLEEIQKWFAKNMPSVKTVAKLKKGSYMSDDPPLWKEIAANKADGAILGVAG
jgi:hypothetical protein